MMRGGRLLEGREEGGRGANNFELDNMNEWSK